jgi:hypothetical protein
MSSAQQSIVDLVEILSQNANVSRVDITLTELEMKIEDFKVTMEGNGLDFEKIRDTIEEFGARIRNVDNVISADEFSSTQDNDKLSASLLVLARHSDLKISNMKQIYDEFDKTLTHIKSEKR